MNEMLLNDYFIELNKQRFQEYQKKSPYFKKLRIIEQPKLTGIMLEDKPGSQSI
jgi:hypothetical protein